MSIKIIRVVRGIILVDPYSKKSFDVNEKSFKTYLNLAERQIKKVPKYFDLCVSVCDPYTHLQMSKRLNHKVKDVLLSFSQSRSYTEKIVEIAEIKALMRGQKSKAPESNIKQPLQKDKADDSFMLEACDSTHHQSSLWQQKYKRPYL